MDLKERLNLSVDQKSVAEYAVQIEQVKKQQPVARVEYLVDKHHWNVERSAWQTKSGGLVACVLVIIDKVETGQPLIEIPLGEIQAMNVITKRSPQLSRV